MPNPFSQQIREQTRHLHDLAEKHPFQRRLVGGALPPAELAAFLGQMLCIHRALSDALRQLRDRDQRVARLILDIHFQDPRLAKDLRALGFDPDGVTPGEACTGFERRVAETGEVQPLRLIGHHYVLEGSNNGARFFVRRLRSALGLPQDQGLSYFDPHGERQPHVWAEFKRGLDEVAQELTEEEREHILQGVVDMYETHRAISDEMTNGAVFSRT